MTPADHAATIREILDAEGTFIYRRDEFLAALDALQAQAEDNTAAIEAVEAEVRKQERHVDTLLKRAEAAEAERDAAVRHLEHFSKTIDLLRAERDAAVQAAEEYAAEINRLTDNIARDMAAIKAAEQAAEQAKAAYTNVKRDYDDVFGQLLRRHSDVDRAEQAAEQARNALREIENFTFDVMDTDEYQSGRMKDIARAALAGNQP